MVVVVLAAFLMKMPLFVKTSVSPPVMVVVALALKVPLLVIHAPSESVML